MWPTQVPITAPLTKKTPKVAARRRPLVNGLVGREEGRAGALALDEALLGQPAAVDRERRPVHVRAEVAREVERGVRDVARLAVAAERHRRGEAPLEAPVAEVLLGQRRPDQARADH